MTPRVVLVGAPGAGKTTVGNLLAQHWGVPFVDTDREIETSVGKSVAEIFYDDGEEHFRELEIAAVAAALDNTGGVVSLGGGAVLSADTRLALREHTVVLLRVGLRAAADRVGFGRDRPVLALSPRATLKFLLDERAPLYAEVATHVVDTDDREPGDVAAELAQVLA